MTTMYDGVTVSRLPAAATMVAGYLNGAWPNITALRARYPHAHIVTITVTADHDGGDVLDVERGDATPQQAPGWATRRRAAGATPTIYCTSTNWAAVKAAFTAAGTAQPLYWIAHWDGVATLPDGAVAKQYANTPGYDISVTDGTWPQEDAIMTMPTPEEYAAAVWRHPLTDPRPGGTLTSTAGGWLTMADIKAGDAASAVTKLTARVAAQSAVISQLVKNGGSLTAEQAETAAQTGATAALAELGRDLTTQAATTP